MNRISRWVSTLGRHNPTLALAGVVILTVLIRFIGLWSAHDIFVDEATYARLAVSVSDGHLAPVLFGRDFYTHPPLFFWMTGLIVKVIGPQANLAELVMTLRLINVVFAGISAALAFGIGRRLGGMRAALGAGVLAGLLFALEPFLSEYDGLVMIETSAMMFVLAGWLVLLRGLQADNSLSRRAIIGAGICFAAALITKETTFFLFAPAMLFTFVSGRLLARRVSAAILTIAALPYIGAFGAMIATDSWSNFVNQKFRGLERLVGSVKITGFKQPGTPSITTKIIENLPHYGTTYVLMGVGVFAVIYLLRRGDVARRLFALGIVGEMLIMAYNMTIGGLVEEQHFYMYVAPVLIAVALMIVDAIAGAGPIGWRSSKLISRIAAIGLIVFLTLDGACLLINRTTNDTDYINLSRYVSANYGPHTAIMSTTSTWELLSGAPFLVDPNIPLADQARTDGSHLVLTSSTQINEGYASIGPKIYDELRTLGAKVVWSQTDWSNGTVELWLLPTPLPR